MREERGFLHYLLHGEPLVCGSMNDMRVFLCLLRFSVRPRVLRRDSIWF